MHILFVGDIFGRPGRRAASECIPLLREQYQIDLCIANGENAAGGAGITESIADRLQACGIDVITTGNHVWDNKDVTEYVNKASRLLRPANYPPDVGGFGATVIPGRVPVGVLNLQGRVYMPSIDCPFRVALRELEGLRSQTSVIIVDIHAEATSEKMALGWYLDGKVSAVIGTHTHVQTCDERVLPNGTAYITDVGMTGPHDSVIGVETDLAITRFLTQLPVRFNPASGGVLLCGVVVDVDERSGKARRIERLRIPASVRDT